MNMAQVRKYKTAGSLPTNKWSYKGKDYEVSGEDLKMLNDWDMSNYQFDPVLPDRYDGVPEGKDVLAKKLGLITEEQYNSKYIPKTDSIASSIVIATKPKKDLKGSRYFIDNVEQDRDEYLKYLYNTLQTDIWSIIDSDKNNNHDYYLAKGSNSFIVKNRDDNSDITDKLFRNIKATPTDSEAKRNLGAFFNSKQHRYREDIARMFGFNKEKPYDGPSIRRGVSEFLYNEDDNKNPIYDVNSDINKDNEQTIREIIDYIRSGKYDPKKEAKYWNEYGTQLDALKNLYDEWSDTTANSFIDALRKGQLTESQKRQLALMGWTQFSSGNQEDKQEEKEEKPVYARASDIFNGDDAEDALKLLGQVTVDDEGNYTLGSDSPYSTGTWDLLMTPEFQNIKYTLAHNGRLYKDYSELDPTQKNIFNPYFSYSNDKHDYASYIAGRDNSPVRFWNDTEWQQQYGQDGYVYAPYNVNMGYIPGLTEYIWKLKKGNDWNVGVRDLRSSYVIPEGTHAYAILNGANSYRTTTSRGTPIYIAFDDQGNIKDFDITKYSKQVSPQNMGKVQGTTWDENGRALKYQIPGTDGANYNIAIDKNGNYWISSLDKNDFSQVTNSETVDLINKIIQEKWTLQDLYNYSASQNRNINTFWSNLSKTPKKAQGGTIDWNRLAKLEDGGIATKIEIKNKEKGENAVKQAHTVYKRGEGLSWNDGPDGGLRPDEKLQVYAAIGDLAGAVTSIVAPSIAGGITGAVIGLGSNIARSAAEKQQNVSFGKRAWHFLRDSAFDIAAVPLSLTQVGDDAVKMAKIVRVIQDTGAPLLKWMGYMGFGTNVINTATKIINGEKYTSEDLSNMISGLAQGLISGKMSAEKLGKARLASELNATNAKKTNEALNQNITASITRKGKQIEVLDQPIKVVESKLKNAGDDPEKAIKAIKDLASSKNGNIELTDDEAKEVLTSIGAQFGTKRSGFWERINPFTKGSKSTFSYTAPKKQDTHGTFYYMRRPDKMKAILRGEDNLLGNITPERYAQAVKNMPTAKASSADRAIIEEAYRNPEAFNLNFDGIKRGPFRGLTNPKAGYRTLASSEKEVLSLPPSNKPSEPVIQIPEVLLLPPATPRGAVKPEFDSYNVTIKTPPIIQQGMGQKEYKDWTFGNIEWFDNSRKAPKSPYMEDMPLSVARTYPNGEAAIGYVRTKRKPPVRKISKSEKEASEQISQEIINPLKAKVIDPMRPTGKRGQKKRGNKGKGKRKLEIGGEIPIFQTPAGSLPGSEYTIRDVVVNTIPFMGDIAKLGIVNRTNIAANKALDPGFNAQKRLYFFAPRKSTITPDVSPYRRAESNLFRTYNSYNPSITSDLGINAAINNGKFQSLLSSLTGIKQQESDYLNKSNIENINRYDYNYNSEGQTAERKWQQLARVALAQAEAKAGLVKQIGSAYNDFVTNQNQRFADKLKLYNAGRDALRKAEVAKKKQQDPTNANQYDNDYLFQTLYVKQGGKTRTMEEQMAIDAARSNQKVIQKMNDSLAKMLIRLMK